MSTLAPGDRAVIFIGQGHAYLLKELLTLSPDVRYVDVLDYLH